MEKDSKNLVLVMENPTFTRELGHALFEDRLILSGWTIGKADKTKIIYGKIAKAFFEFFPGLTVVKATPAHLTVFLKDAAKRGLKPTTLNLYRNTLSSLFKYAVKIRRMEHDPSLGVSNYRIQDNLHEKIMSLEQVQQMLFKTKRERDQLLIKVLFYLGLRAGEVVEIKMSDFMHRKDGVFLIVKGKGSKTRQAPIDDSLWRDIVKYSDRIELRSNHYLFSDEKDSSRKITTHSIWVAIRAIAVKAKIKPVPSPHWFRHTSATLAIEGGAHIHVVQARLGHASLSTTSKYLHAKASDGLSKYLPKLKD